MTTGSPKFIERIKNHHIRPVATIYAIAAWILIQACNSIFPDIGLSKESVRLVITTAALGFPVVLVLAWMLIPPSATNAAKLSRWQRFHWRVGSALSIAVIVLVTFSGWYLWKHGAYTSKSVASVAAVAKDIAHFNPPPHSIAVLPFANLSNDGRQQYFCDGITEELTDALGAVPGMQVIAWRAAAVYHNTDQPLKTVGMDLNVANVLVGSIMRDNNMLRVSAELVNTLTGYQLWSSHYDRELKDVFSIQDDISKSIVGALQVQLTDAGPIVTPATANPQAHDAYLKGLAAFNMRTAAGFNDALDHFKHAIRLDPNYASAYAGLAHTYYLLHQYQPVSLTETLAEAKQAAQKSLALNPDLVEAHVVLGLVYFSEHQSAPADSELRRALNLDPNSYAAHQAYGMFMFPTRDALAQFEMAVTLDPNAPIAWINIGNTYADLGDYPNALKALQTALPLDPGLIYVALDIAYMHHLLSANQDAIAVLGKVRTEDKTQSMLLEAARLTYDAMQNPSLKDRALSAVNKLHGLKLGQVDSEQLATYYQLLGQGGQAIQVVAQLCANGPEYCSDIGVDSHYLLLHKEPEFKKLVAQYATAH